MIPHNPEKGQIACSKISWYNKTVIDGCITMYISSYMNIYPVIYKSWSRLSTTRRIYFTWQFCFYLLSDRYISNISNIYNLDEKLSLASQTICDYMFSDTKSDHYFHIFGLRTWLIFYFFMYVAIFHLLWRYEGVGIYCKLIPDWIESTPERIWSPAQYRTKL